MVARRSELETALRRYISSFSVDRNSLGELLKNESVDKRFELLVSLKGMTEVFNTWTVLHRGTIADDLETIMYMLSDFSPNQIYDLVKIQKSDKWTALHIAAANGHTAIMNFLLSDLSQRQRYDLLKLQTPNGDTTLHKAAINKEAETVRAIIHSVSSPLLIHLFPIRNKDGKTVTDIMPKLHDELPVLISQGIASIYSVN